MQIVFKVKDGCFDDARKAVMESVSEVLSPAAREKMTLQPVFPGVTSGRRRGLCVLDLPDDLSGERLQRVLRRLESDDSIEYAEVPAAKGPA